MSNNSHKMLCLNPSYNLENSPNLLDYFITTIRTVGKLEHVCGGGGVQMGDWGNWMMTAVIAGTRAWESVWRGLTFLKPLNYGKISNICKSKEKGTTDPHVSITQLQDLEFFATFVLSLFLPFIFSGMLYIKYQIPALFTFKYFRLYL